MPAEILPVITTTFKPEKHIPVEGASIIIKETSREASLKSVKLVSLGTEAVGLKFDLCGFPGDKVFNTPDLQRACDAIVFCQFQGEGYILCCELKSSEPTRNEATVQFRSSLCFTDYVESVLKNYHHLSIHGWKRRYFLFHDAGKTPISKPPLCDQVITNDHPEKAHFIPVQNGASIYLRKLLGKPL